MAITKIPAELRDTATSSTGATLNLLLRDEILDEPLYGVFPVV